MTYEQKQMIRRLSAKGLTVRAIAREMNFTPNGVHVTVVNNQVRPGRPDKWTPRPGPLRAEEREDIWLGMKHGESMSGITRSLGRSASTITREVAKNGGTENYGPWHAHCRARQAVYRSRPPELSHALLKAQVTAWLEEFWSPQEIAARLRLEFPDDSMMWVSHETIDKSLFVEGRGELRRELTRCLRTGRKKRRPHGSQKSWGHVHDMVMIADRPLEVNDRAVPGH